MSGASKRLHEDGGHSTPIKRSHEESSMLSGLSGKTGYSLSNDFHMPYEPGHDGPLVKVQRMESRDSDKRPLHRKSSSPSHGGVHTTTSENRLEMRASKEAKDVKTVIREIKSDTRDFCIDIKTDLQASKPESDTRDARGDEKDLRSDRGSCNDFKGVVKFERDNYAASMLHTSWKESKDHLWPKRYTEPTIESMESRRIERHLQNTIEVGKDQAARNEDRNLLGSHEGIAENKVDLKCEDKLREKDKKRKDDRQKDFGEWDKDRNDRRRSMQLGEVNNEGKEFKEDRELAGWERELKDFQKDKEQNNQVKDYVKRESLNSNERENSHYGKDVHEGSIKIPDQSVSTSDSKRPKDDGLKGSDRDLRDKKREMDAADVGDRFVQPIKCYDKNLDDGIDGDGGLERDKDAFGYGIQQRRRMLRSRGITQPTYREPRFRSRAHDYDGSQGKPDVSAVVYRAGDCMQEILRTWREFEASQDSKIAEPSQNYPTLEIRIPMEYVTSTNRQVRGAQLWGTDVYTNDSDLVAVLMHTGYCCPTSVPPSAIHELRTTIQVLPPQECYTSTLRNNVRSRSWGAGIGCSFHVERCCIVKKGGGSIDLEPCRTHLSTVEPTIAPVSAERTMTTRAAASNALRQQRFVREVTIQYNLCNEPWLKYSINIVADMGLKKPLYTSARLKKGEVLYLETHYKRYELCFNGEKSICNGMTSTFNHLIELEQEKQQSHHILNGDKYPVERENVIDVYRWSHCKKPLPQDVMHSTGIPLPVEHLEVLEENLDWEDVQWSQTGVWVAGKEYALSRVHFLSSN